MKPSARLFRRRYCTAPTAVKQYYCFLGGFRGLFRAIFSSAVVRDVRPHRKRARTIVAASPPPHSFDRTAFESPVTRTAATAATSFSLSLSTSLRFSFPRGTVTTDGLRACTVPLPRYVMYK